MSTDRSADYLVSLVRELCKLPHETEWMEIKVNNSNPSEIGEYISVLANSAVLCDKHRAYVLWGVEDGTRRLVGTRFEPSTVKQGNEDVENWLTRLLQPQVPFRFYTCEVEDARVVLLEIDRPLHQPVRFNGEEYIRVGSYTKKLKDHPEKERALWGRFTATVFEDGMAAQRLSGEEILQLLAFPSYFDLLQVPLPPN